MNFDRFNPLSLYLHTNGVEMSDWGIEESTTVSTPTISAFPPSKNFLPPENKHHDFSYYYTRLGSTIAPNTDNFSKYIHKYLSLGKMTQQFTEKFKYTLIVLDLLDDAMILSKTDQALNTLVYREAQMSQSDRHLIRSFNDNGTELSITRKNYQMRFPNLFQNPYLVVKIVMLVVYLLKQNIKSRILSLSSIKMFKVLLIAATRVILFRRVTLSIQFGKVLNLLNEFLKNNYRINKKLILSLLCMKEQQLFKTPSKDAGKIKENLGSCLTLLISDLKSSVTTLVPFLNGDVLEKYCHVNNIDLDTLFGEEDADDYITIMTSKMNKFNQLRKLLVSQLLTIHEPARKNFFLCKLCDHLGVEDSEVDSLGISSFEKLRIIEQLFDSCNAVVSSFTIVMENFEKINRIAPKLSDQNVLTMPKPTQESSIGVLVDKLGGLATSLSFFNKYNQLIANLNNEDELHEKIEIFAQFGADLNVARELYQTSLSELQTEVYQKNGQYNISPTIAQTPANAGGAGLKSFHISARAPTRSVDAAARARDSDLRPKRLSTGLQILIHDNNNHHSRTSSASSMSVSANRYGKSDRKVSYDTEAFQALDSLNRKGIRSSGINRFSINSMNSNVSGFSDLLASTQTSYDEESGLSKEDLRLRLEESFARMYEEKRDLRNAPNPDETEQLSPLSPQLGFAKQSFLLLLEKTLEERV